ncbi:MAG TPA: NUDIX domain-containing protein [Candidatus Saccharimonadales bacterium]|nr:NUDIX domain-containing protein [Candidatus Saccharimonadales bacterium]
MARIIIVDEQDEIIGHKERGTLDASDIYRVAALWITNSDGSILLAQRKFTKKHDPGKWGPAVAGTVDEGETYDSNIAKEAAEEIGLTDLAGLMTGPKIRFNNTYQYFCQWYRLCIDWPIQAFTIQESEVEQIKWFTPTELTADFQQHTDHYVPTFEITLQRFGLTSD